MKHFFATLLAVGMLGMGSAAFADYHNQGRPPMHGGMSQARYRDGQMYRGHRLHRYHGRWGYYQPRNGVNVFINI